MKYARRSVSDQDIRRYEMFSQVRFISHPCIHYVVVLTVVFHIRTCNNPAVSGTTSSSLKVILLEHLPARAPGTLDLLRTLPTMTYTLEGLVKHVELAGGRTSRFHFRIVFSSHCPCI